MMSWGSFITPLLGNVGVGAIVTFFCAKVLKDPESVRRIHKVIAESRPQRAYTDMLSWILRRVDDVFGSRLLHLHAFAVCLVFAFIYPVLLLVLSWLISGKSSFGQSNALPAGWPFWQRLLFVLILGIWAAGITTFCSSAGKILNWVSLPLKQTSHVGNLLTRVSCILLGISAAAGAGMVAVTIAAAGAISVAVAAAVAGRAAATFTAPGKGLGAVAIAGEFAIAGAIVGASAISIAHTDNPESMVLFLFISSLPLLNALFDFISWLVSRWLLGYIASEKARFMVVFCHGLLDLFLALVFLVLLALSLGFMIESVTLYTGHDGKFDWRAHVNEAVDDPLGAGMLVTLMLGSTLLPTIAHFVIAGLALVTRGMPWHRWLKRELSAALERIKHQKERGVSEKDFKIFDELTRAIIALAIAVEIAVAVAGALLLLGGCAYIWSVWSEPIGEELRHAAFWAGNRAHDLLDWMLRD